MNKTQGKGLLLWFFIIVAGFVMFVIPQIPFQMGWLGGFQGKNLTIVALLQGLLVIPLLYWGLRRMKLSFRSIGLTKQLWLRDTGIGIGVAACWAALQFGWLIPSTGGAERADIVEIKNMLDGAWVNILWYLPLGVLGGGIIEELYNRGFIVGVISHLFERSKVAIVAASVFAIAFFAAGHIPTNTTEWIDLLVPSTAYTILYVSTGRLIAPMVAHGLWNSLAAVLVYVLYV